MQKPSERIAQIAKELATEAVKMVNTYDDWETLEMKVEVEIMSNFTDYMASATIKYLDEVSDSTPPATEGRK